MKKIILIIMSFLALIQSCATSKNKKIMVLERATFDLNCPLEKLLIQELGGNSYGVRGCELRATYLVVCPANSMASSCNVVLNGNAKKENKIN